MFLRHLELFSSLVFELSPTPPCPSFLIFPSTESISAMGAWNGGLYLGCGDLPAMAHSLDTRLNQLLATGVRYQIVGWFFRTGENHSTLDIHTHVGYARMFCFAQSGVSFVQSTCVGKKKTDERKLPSTNGTNITGLVWENFHSRI